MTSRLLMAVLIVATITVSARAQRLSEGEAAFDRKASQTNTLRKQLFRNFEKRTDPNNPNHVEAVEVEAKQHLYPLYWKTERRPRSGDINNFVEAFGGTLAGLSSPRAKANTAETQQLFCRKAVEAIVEIMKNDSARPIATLNAARALSLIPQRRTPQAPQPVKDWIEEVGPRLANGNGEMIANVCLELLEDPRTNDGAKYYLYQTMASLLGLPHQTSMIKSETQEKMFAAAAGLVEKPNPFPKATPRQDVEGYKMLRLQAVIVLAQATTPVVGKTRIALILGRVAGNDARIIPAPRVDERVEAAIGLTHFGLHAAKFPEFQLEYAIVQIARAITSLGEAANQDLEAQPPQRRGPWVIYAARLIESAGILKEEAKAPYVRMVMDQCLKDVLNPVERRGESNHAGLSDWLGLNPPPEMAKTLFKNDPESEIQSRDEPAKE